MFTRSTYKRHTMICKGRSSGEDFLRRASCTSPLRSSSSESELLVSARVVTCLRPGTSRYMYSKVFLVYISLGKSESMQSDNETLVSNLVRSYILLYKHLEVSFPGVMQHCFRTSIDHMIEDFNLVFTSRGT
jgi:hypothetical protein